MAFVSLVGSLVRISRASFVILFEQRQPPPPSDETRVASALHFAKHPGHFSRASDHFFSLFSLFLSLFKPLGLNAGRSELGLTPVIKISM